jgi:hypothetical protein
MANNINSTLDMIRKSSREYKKAYAESAMGKTNTQIAGLTKFYYQVTRGSYWVWSKLLYPAGKFLTNPIRWIFRKYRELWNFLVYKVDEYGVKHFSSMRAGLMIIATVLFLNYIPHLAWDTSTFILTSKHHVIYLSNSQELSHERNVHAVRGCDETPFCSEQEAVYYRADPDLFNQFWSLWTHYGLFYPDYIAAAVPPTVHKCYVFTYGWRIKWLMRNWDWYPEILEVRCVPLEGSH